MSDTAKFGLILGLLGGHLFCLLSCGFFAIIALVFILQGDPRVGEAAKSAIFWMLVADFTYRKLADELAA